VPSLEALAHMLDTSGYVTPLRLRTFSTKAAAAAQAGDRLVITDRMVPLRSYGVFSWFWNLGEVTRWNESTVTVRFLTEQLDDVTVELERPPAFEIPGQVTAQWATEQAGGRPWLFRRKCGELFRAHVVDVDGDYIWLRLADGKLTTRHAETFRVVELAHVIGYVAGSEPARDGDREVWSYTFRAWCSCREFSHRGPDRNGRTLAVSSHLAAVGAR
jgi:hypothetical protein